MLIKEMLKLNDTDLKDELDRAEHSVGKLTVRAKLTGNKPAHRKCIHYDRSLGGDEYCNLLKCLYCKLEDECSFENTVEIVGLDAEKKQQ